MTESFKEKIARDLADMTQSSPPSGHPAFTGVEFKPKGHDRPAHLRSSEGAISIGDTVLTGLGNPDYDPSEKPVVIEPRPYPKALDGGPSPMSGYGEDAQE